MKKIINSLFTYKIQYGGQIAELKMKSILLKLSTPYQLLLSMKMNNIFLKELKIILLFQPYPEHI